ncbi:MAG: phage protein GemA/Gp16 family protein [Panacagrimonas sp.]
MISDPRNRELARIHVLKKDLRLDDDQYRTLLWTVARVESSRDLDTHGRQQVIQHMEAHAKRAKKSYPARPNNVDTHKRAELTKIEALLTDAGKPWSYAEGIMRRITFNRKQRLEWCDESELMKIIAALERNALKRLSSELKELFGEFWREQAAYLAAHCFAFDAKHRSIESYSEPMSQVLRWWRGELEAACPWPRDRLKWRQACPHCNYVAKAQAAPHA